MRVIGKTISLMVEEKNYGLMENSMMAYTIKEFKKDMGFLEIEMEICII